MSARSPGALASAPDAPPADRAAGGDRNSLSDHEASEGFILAAAASPPRADAPCDPAAPLRRYDVAAIDVDITVNRYLDHDPEGRMYALEGQIPQVTAEEAANARARAGRGEPAVSFGLQGDAIQPLTLRVRQGECLRIAFRDALAGGEPAGIHLHGSGLHLAGGGPAIASNPGATVTPGSTVAYEWMVGAGEPEGTHYFHSHGDDRFQTDHGLFGAVIVEPQGSTWTDPLTGAEARGWDAMVRTPSGAAFREFALYYHEIGDENYLLLDHAGAFVPQVDPTTGSYRPDGRALNYRSEPFMNRLVLQRSAGATLDESLEYSSYSFGDPPTPIMRSYLGDPVKQRVVHAGSEVFHVHHVHGGGIRWLRQPGTEPSSFDRGLDKRPPLRPQHSERTDSQALGPSETFDIADECGSGGCQQSAGDFMYHCHVTEHYFSGMWGIWRVYNTRQDGPASTDAMPALLELPDRAGRAAPAVTSDALIGRTVTSYGQSTAIDAAGLGAWVERQLPPAGVPHGYDASVLDWQRQGARYLGEPETDSVWPGYRARAPGARPALLFASDTGRLAYPMLRPHLDRRPPFAPGHGPAPFLDPVMPGTDTPAPGANGAASDCPAGTRLEPVAINAISVPVTLSRRQDLVDPFGQLFVLRGQEDAVRADPAMRVPLAIRANAGEDCLDVTLRSELADNGGEGLSKVGAHIHLVQFDIQASDGVDTGFNYEQTVRPFRAAGQPVVAEVPAGATRVMLPRPGDLQAGAMVGIGVDQDAGFEVARIAGVDPGGITLAAPLTHAHGGGEIVSTEFVRYRWYPDVQFGTAFFHDHVNVLQSGRHGLYGALESEPPGSTYHDPRTGVEIESGTVADIHTEAPVSADVRGSFRELLMFLQDDNPITHIGRSSGSSVNLRADPPEPRARDPAQRFSSAAGGDPETPVLEARLGDPIALRTLVGASNDVHTLHVDGHWFRLEPNSRSSPPTDTFDVAISERRDVFIPAAGGPQRMPGDYLWYAGRSFELREGDWGILRVDGPGQGDALRPLPGHEVMPAPATSVCPPEAPRDTFDVAAIDAPLPMLNSGTTTGRGHRGKLYVLGGDRQAVLSGRRPPTPLVLHAGVGDCITINLTNDTRAGAVSFHADMLAFDPGSSGGVEGGREPPQAVAPGGHRTYTLYASPQVGETTALVRDWGDVLVNPGLGLYGAIIVGPPGARYTDPRSGADVSRGSAWEVDVHPPSQPSYRDSALFFQDEDAGIGTHRMPYTVSVEGPVGLNYMSEPLEPRSAANRTVPSLSRRTGQGDPATPLLEAYPGDPVRIHVLAPWSEQAQVFSIEGHRWRVEPGLAGSPLVSSMRFAGLEALTISLDGGASSPGDYVYGDHRGPYLEAGLWGLLRVRSSCDVAGSPLRPLDSGCPPGAPTAWRVVLAAGAAILVAVVMVGVFMRRRRWTPWGHRRVMSSRRV